MKIFNQYKGLRRELYILFIGKVMTCMGSMVQPMLTLILSKKLGFSAGKIAGYFLIYTIVSLPFNLLGGKLADRFNKRNIIICFDLISVLGYIYCFFAVLDIKSIIIFSVSGLFQNIEYPAYDALIADFTTGKDRERAYSMEYLGTNLGLVLAPTIGGMLFNDYLNYAFLINGCSILLSTLLIFTLIKDVHKEESLDAPDKYEAEIDDKISGFQFLAKNRVMLLYFFSIIFEGTVYSMFNYLMPLDMGVVHGDNGAVLFGTMNSINCAVVIFCTAFITRAFSKLRETNKMLLGEFLQLAGYLIFALFIKNVLLCYICMIIFTLGEIFRTLASSPFITRRIPSSHRGRIMSILNVCSSVLSTLLCNAVGRVHDNFGMNPAWTLVIFFGIINMLLIAWMKKYDRKDYKDLYNM